MKWVLIALLFVSVLPGVKRVLVVYELSGEACGGWSVVNHPSLLWQPAGPSTCPQYQWFESVEEAMAWMTTVNLSDQAKPEVYRVEPVPITGQRVTISIPQPAKTESRYHWREETQP